MSVDSISGRIAQYEPLMTGAYRDSLKKTPAFSIDSVLSEPASSNQAHAAVPATPAQPAAPAPAAPSQTLATLSDFRQLFSQSASAPAVVTPSTTTAVVVSTPAVAMPAVEAQSPDAGFVPTFRAATGSAPGLDTWNLNRTYFASSETAQWIANKYGTGEVVERPFGGSNAFFGASANEYHIKLKDGRIVNAGILASYYERNPPDKFPGLADKLIKSTLGLA